MKKPDNPENIWKALPRPFLVLAPMEGVTDVIFRQVVTRAGEIAARRCEVDDADRNDADKSGFDAVTEVEMSQNTLHTCPDLFFTEFTNVSSYASEKGRANALERLEVAPSDAPIIAQVWGKQPEHFAICVGALQDLGFSGVDLNYGCPDRHVNKAGGGAAMIQNPELAVECLRQAKKATNLPVSVKTRLGWSKIEEFQGWLTTLLAEYPAALTVHLRTKKEMSKVPAHYEIIPEIVKLRDEVSPETKLVINGDIRDRAAGLALAERFPGVDGLMIGRGIFQNPFCFVGRDGAYGPADSVSEGDSCQSASFMSENDAYQPTREELVELLEFHLGLFEAKIQQNYRSFEPLKHFFKIYVNNFPGAAEVRAKLMETHAVPEAREVIEKYLK